MSARQPIERPREGRLANPGRRCRAAALLVVALGLSTLSLGRPAAAAVGLHAAYFSQSASLTRAPGEVGQFAVGYVNSGDRAWVKGLAAQQANLATAAPLDNTADYVAGWAVGWLSANRYAAQDPVLVSPGQIAFFIYTVVVPTGTPVGAHAFYGRPVIDGVTFLEDYGYFHTLTVTATPVVPPVALVGPDLVAASASAPREERTTRVDVRWSVPVRCAGTYAVDGVPATVIPTPATSCQLTTRPLAAGSTHTLTVTGERDHPTGTGQHADPAWVSFTVTVLPATCDRQNREGQRGPDQGAVARTGIPGQGHGARQPDCDDGRRGRD